VKPEILNKSPKEILQDFMQSALLLCKAIGGLADLCDIDKLARKDLHRQTTILEQFLSCLNGSRTLEILFCIAITGHYDSIRAELRDLLSLYNISENSADVEENSKQRKPRPEIGVSLARPSLLCSNSFLSARICDEGIWRLLGKMFAIWISHPQASSGNRTQASSTF
jgi:hypothetical protein